MEVRYDGRPPGANRSVGEGAVRSGPDGCRGYAGTGRELPRGQVPEHSGPPSVEPRIATRAPRRRDCGCMPGNGDGMAESITAAVGS